jgi:molybdenum cofactor synthesis domain-containing protein
MTHKLTAQPCLAILTISDSGTRGDRKDVSGDTISYLLAAAGFHEVDRTIVPDEIDLITPKLKEWSDYGEIDVVLTTGGTGLGPRDVTPEATRAVLDMEIPGITEAMRTITSKSTPYAMLSRSVSGVRSGCLIINLPGSPAGVKECIEVILPIIPHALEMIRGWRTHKPILQEKPVEQDRKSKTL